MVSSFILPYKPLEWAHGSSLVIDPIAYVNQLRLKWPEIKQYSSEGSNTHLLQWRLTPDDEIGGLQVDRQVVDFGSGPNFISFVVWHREFVIAAYPLYLCDNGSEQYIELSPGITQEQVRERLGRL